MTEISIELAVCIYENTEDWVASESPGSATPALRESPTNGRFMLRAVTYIQKVIDSDRVALILVIT